MENGIVWAKQACEHVDFDPSGHIHMLIQMKVVQKTSRGPDVGP